MNKVIASKQLTNIGANGEAYDSVEADVLAITAHKNGTHAFVTVKIANNEFVKTVFLTQLPNNEIGVLTRFPAIVRIRESQNADYVWDLVNIAVDSSRMDKIDLGILNGNALFAGAPRQ